ncbi:IS200/IS605 family transposase [Acidiferrobacter thiooxydans]|uniref:IS200/IS605 family transposase n=2 Tax=Acidiferrobacter thiooxydans TaxID=163359 RepID=A0A368HMH9_9GAMM|nr:IS200/IS605 family transposase [Acidiferrobacter thiooxydans]
MMGPRRGRLEAIRRSTAAPWECAVRECNGGDGPWAFAPGVDTGGRKDSRRPSSITRKTVSSRWLRKGCAGPLKTYDGNKPVFWSRRYGPLPVGGAPLSGLKPYIEQQERPE